MKKSLLALLLSVCAIGVQAQIKLQPMFSDNMVLQQNTQAPIWGEAGAGSQVRVTTSWNKRTVETVAQADGTWRVCVDTPKAGGPYDIKIEEAGGSVVTLRNVLIGEVWLCTGQSNMEMPLAAWGFIDNYEQEIANADNYPRIRLINMKHVISPLPRTDIAAQTDGWEVCSSKTVGGFSAAGYFFGVNLQKSLGVPIGLIATNWGGTLAESWTSEESLMQMPYFRDLIEKVKTMPADIEEQKRQYEDADIAYWKTFAEGEMGIGPEDGSKFLWSAPDLNDSAWGTIAQPGKVEENGLSGFDGVVWIRRTVDIPAAWEGQALTLSLGAIDDMDITFFNGVEVGRNDLWFAPRTYTIPAELVKAGRATIAIRIMDTGADGGLTASADQLYIANGNDNGNSQISLAGQWKYRVANDLRNYPPRPVNMAGNPNLPTVLYNSMLNPLVGYALKGAIWYQGESNVDRAAQYRELLPVMINDWRTKWKAPLDFYIVQLANFMRQQTAPEESTWAELREAQMWTAQHLDRVGIACAIDIGMADDIHPKNKQEVGRRLALAALAQSYGKKMAYSGPVYKCYRIEGNKIRLYFDHVGKGFQMKWPDSQKKQLQLDHRRLNSSVGHLSGSGGPFTIAGPDKKFHWAEWKVEGETIVVWSPDVPFPVSVRYGWANNPDTRTAIYNTDGLPMFPFRTDQWPAITTLTAQ